MNNLWVPATSHLCGTSPKAAGLGREQTLSCFSRAVAPPPPEFMAISTMHSSILLHSSAVGVFIHQEHRTWGVSHAFSAKQGNQVFLPIFHENTSDSSGLLQHHKVDILRRSLGCGGHILKKSQSTGFPTERCIRQRSSWLYTSRKSHRQKCFKFLLNPKVFCLPSKACWLISASPCCHFYLSASGKIDLYL